MIHIICDFKASSSTNSQYFFDDLKAYAEQGI